jgi:mandelate racemase
MTGGGFTIRGLSLRSLVVPMARPLVTGVVTSERAACVLIDLETEERITGRSYLFGYSKAGNDCFLPPLRWLSDAMKGEKVTPGAPPDQLFNKARKALTLMGHEGIAMIAVSGFDMACWDAYAQAQGQPLVEALVGKAAPVTAYNSCGLGIIEAKAAAEEAKIPVSSHLFPEFSSHLLATTPAAHWLEFTNWSAPLLENPVTVTDGHVHVSDAPGAGIAWSEDAVEKYSVAI